MTGSRAADLTSHPASGGRVLWAIVAGFISMAVGASAYFAYSTIDRQRAEGAVLVRELVSASNQRDDLLGVRAQLTSERDQLSLDLDGQRARAVQAESALVEANRSVAQLQTEAKANAVEVQRLSEQVARQIERVQEAQFDARDSSSAAAAAATARRRAENIANAALTYADASSALSRTRDRMIDLSRAQIDAERARQVSTANALVAEYNSLLPVHYRQVGAVNTALANLRSLL